MTVERIGALERMRRSWRRSMRRFRTLKELAACPPQELNGVASDAGLSGGAELRQHRLRDHGSRDLLPQRLRVLNIDPEFVRQDAPALFKDLARACAACRESRRCGRDLDVGDAQIGMTTYCLNAPTIDLLTAHRSNALPALEQRRLTCLGG
jgi:hypothetical protein